MKLETERVLKTLFPTTCLGLYGVAVLRTLFLSASVMSSYLWFSLTLGMLIL